MEFWLDEPIAPVVMVSALATRWYRARGLWGCTARILPDDTGLSAVRAPCLRPQQNDGSSSVCRPHECSRMHRSPLCIGSQTFAVFIAPGVGAIADDALTPSRR